MNTQIRFALEPAKIQQNAKKTKKIQQIILGKILKIHNIASSPYILHNSYTWNILRSGSVCHCSGSKK